MDWTDRLRPGTLGWRFTTVLVAFVGYVWAALAAGDGAELVPPLDDPYIHLQFARNLAAGDFFSYLPGGPYSTGDTSPAYVFLLVPAFWLGLDGSAALWWMFAISGLLHFAVVTLGMRLLERLTPSALARTVGLLLLAFWGPWAWGVYLGMEVAMTAALLLVILHGGDEGRAGGAARTARPWRIARLVALVALPLTRPEGLFLGAIAIGLQSLPLAGGRARLRRVALEGLTLLPFGGYLVLNRIATGSFETAGYIVKAASASPDMEGLGVVAHAAQSFSNLFSNLYLSLRFEYLPPLAAVWLIVALVPRATRAWQQGERPDAVLIAAWWLAHAGLTSLAWYPEVHRARYLLPLFPLYLVVAAAALGDLLTRLRRSHPTFGVGLAMFLVVTMVGANALWWVQRFIDDGREIGRVQVRLGHWLAEHTDPDDIIGVHDAGAMVYLSNRRAVDIVGLGTAEFAVPFRHGQGSVFEALGAMPPEERPDVYAVSSTWFDTPVQGRILARAAVPLAEIIPSTTFFVYEAVDSVFDPASELPLRPDFVPQGWGVVAAVDIAHLGSEEAVGYANLTSDRLAPSTNFAEEFGAGGLRYADGGRTVFAAERFTFSLDPSRPAALLARIADGGGGAVGVDVRVDGELVGEMALPEGQSFGEVGLPLPELGAAEVAFELRPSDGNPYKSFHYWIVQPRSETASAP
jgi:hypothetical protein